MRGTPTPRRQDPLPGRDNLLFTVARNDLAVNMDQCLTLTLSARTWRSRRNRVKELSKATEAILEAQNTILDMTRVMIDWLPIGGTSPRGKQDPLNLQSYNYPLSSVLTRPSGSSLR